MEGVTQRLSQFIAETSLSDIPAEVRHQAKRTLLNYFGCACGGCRHESVEAVIRAKAGWSGPPATMVIGRKLAVSPDLAALLNGMSSAVYSFDDTHRDAMVHPGGPVASALLALTPQVERSGADFLVSFILGAELVCRLSKAISAPPAQARPEWIQTGICAGIGAAAASARLLNLPENVTTSAIGIAACRASGFRGLSRSMCFSYMAGSAAEAGVNSAYLAQAGMIGSEDPLGGAQGFCAVFSKEFELEYLTSGLGDRYELLNNTFKPYPCGVVIHPVIDACLALRNGIADPSDVAGIRVKVHPNVEQLANIPDPTDQFEAQMSLQHWAACAILESSAGVVHTTPEYLRNESVAAIRRLVEIDPDQAIPRSGAEVIVQLRSGNIVSERIAACRGSANRPLTDADLEAKFDQQAIPVLGRSDARELAQACWEIEALPKASVLMQFAEGGHGCR